MLIFREERNADHQAAVLSLAATPVAFSILLYLPEWQDRQVTDYDGRPVAIFINVAIALTGKGCRLHLYRLAARKMPLSQLNRLQEIEFVDKAVAFRLQGTDRRGSVLGKASLSAHELVFFRPIEAV